MIFNYFDMSIHQPFMIKEMDDYGQCCKIILSFHHVCVIAE